MDPFSIATGVIGLAQGLMELVSKNRKKAKQLATHTYEIVEAVQEFHGKYSHLFAENQDFQKRVVDLYKSLISVVEKCKEMLPKPEKHVVRNYLAGFRAWLKRGELEDCLIDLNTRAQQCQLKFMTLSTLSADVTIHEMHTITARMDTNISSIHQRVVVQKNSKDSPGRDDSQSGPISLSGDHIAPGSPIGIPKSPSSQLSDDDVKHAFLRLQVKEIDKLLSKLLRVANTSFHIPPPQFDDPTHARLRSQLYIPWEDIQRHTALESVQLIDKIHNADSSTSVDDVGAALTHLGYRYEHLGMRHEALSLSALAIQLGRLAVEAYPHSDGLRRGLAIRLENYAGLLLDCRKSKVEATQCMIEAVSIQRKLVAQLPHPGRKVNLANSLSKSSWLARRTGDLETAESHSAEALGIILDIMDAPPGTIPDANTLRLTRWAGVERNGILSIGEWKDQAIFLYPDILDERFRCALARKSFSDAYEYATVSRNVYRLIADRHPQSHLVTLRRITTELLGEWADPLRSRTDTITFCTEAINYISAIPSRQGDFERKNLFQKYTLQAKLSLHLYNANNRSAAFEAQKTASLYWDHYYATYPEMARKKMSSLSGARLMVVTLHQQIQIYDTGRDFARLPANTPLRGFSTTRISKHLTLAIPGQASQTLHQQAKMMEQWLRGAHPAVPSPELGRPKSQKSLMYGQFNAGMAACFARLGDFDAAHQAARHAIDTSRAVMPQDPWSCFTENEGKTWWDVVVGVLDIAVCVLEACIATPNDPRSLPCAHDVVALVKSLFPTQEPICIPSDVDALGIIDDIGAAFAIYGRHLEILRRMDESLSTSKSNLIWYTARAPSSYPTNPDYQHVALVLDLARNLVYAGQWSSALRHTTTVFHAIVFNPTLANPSDVGRTPEWWTLALLTHCSILTELGRMELAAQCISQGMVALTTANSRDRNKWKRPALVRKAMISSLLEGDFAEEMERMGNCKKVDLRATYTRDISYYFLAPSRIYSGLYLDLSCIFADIGDYKQAIAHAQEALSSIETLTTDILNQWQDFALVQQRTDSGIALAVAFTLGGHIQDAAELFPHLFDIYKKELQYQRNLYPGYAVAIRLAGWVFHKVGNVAEARKMKGREVGLEYLFDEVADEETLRVIRIRLEMEEGRPAIRRVREILGVKPYQPEPVA